MNVRPALSPAAVTPESFAGQVFGTSAATLDRLPPQWRGALFLGVAPDTAEGLVASFDAGQRSAACNPHDTFLAFNGKAIQ